MTQAGLIKALRRAWSREPWFVEFWSSVALVLWGALAATVSPLSGWGVFAPMTDSIGAAAWPWLAVSIGLVQAAAVVADSRKYRWVAAGAASWAYANMTLSFLTSFGEGVVLPVATAAYGGWLLANTYSLVRLRFP